MRRDRFALVIEKTENVDIVAHGRSRGDDCNSGAVVESVVVVEGSIRYSMYGSGVPGRYGHC
jgi:hypothetical protein